MFARRRVGDHFQAKIRLEACHLDLLEYIQEQAVLKELLWDFHKIKVCGKVSILKMVKINSFIGALKTPVLLFQKYFQVKLR